MDEAEKASRRLETALLKLTASYCKAEVYWPTQQGTQAVRLFRLSGLESEEW